MILRAKLSGIGVKLWGRNPEPPTAAIYHHPEAQPQRPLRCHPTYMSVDRQYAKS